MKAHETIEIRGFTKNLRILPAAVVATLLLTTAAFAGLTTTSRIEARTANQHQHPGGPKPKSMSPERSTIEPSTSTGTGGGEVDSKPRR